MSSSSKSPNVRTYPSLLGINTNFFRMREKHARRAASAVSSPVNTHPTGMVSQSSTSVDAFPDASQVQNFIRPPVAVARSVSHPPEYPHRRDEEQTGVEIATKVLGGNNKNGQAPFYTG